VVALNATLGEVWRIAVGGRLLGLAISPNDGHVYATTRHEVVKIRDDGTRGEVAWRWAPDAFPGLSNVLTMQSTLTTSGLVVGVTGGRSLLGLDLVLRVGIGLLDPFTGDLASFTQGEEEPVGGASVTADGSILTASFPTSRAVTRALLGPRVPSLMGGITKFRSSRADLQLRDAACAAAALAQRSLDPEARVGARASMDQREEANLSREAVVTSDDLRHVQALVKQAGRAAIAQSAVAHESNDRLRRMRFLLAKVCCILVSLHQLLPH
jgi:hypothetical protein